jgi:VanZ family protein
LSGAVFRLALRAGALFFCAVLGRFFKYWLPLVFWMCVIFCASTGLGRPDNTSRIIVPLLRWLDPHMSEEMIDTIHHYIRKAAHFTEYAILGVLLWRFVYFDPAMAAYRTRSFGMALLLAALYASSDEFHQKFVPGRESAVGDVAIDTCGAGFGLVTVWSIRRLRPKK